MIIYIHEGIPMKHFEIGSVHFAKVNKLKENHEILKQIAKLRFLSVQVVWFQFLFFFSFV